MSSISPYFISKMKGGILPPLVNNIHLTFNSKMFYYIHHHANFHIKYATQNFTYFRRVNTKNTKTSFIKRFCYISFKLIPLDTPRILKQYQYISYIA